MLVKFKTNLGSSDAGVHDLDFRACTQGSEVEVSDAAGKWLIGKGRAAAVVSLKAVPAIEIKAAAPIEPKPEAKSAPLARATARSKPIDKTEGE